MKKGAIFFDLDGTLFDTRDDLAGAVNHLRADLGLEPISVESVISNVGNGARFLLKETIREVDAPFEELWEKFSVRYREHCCDKLLPYPAVEETLEELVRRGWKLGVNTNKPRFAVDLILKKFSFGKFFGEAVVAGGEGIALKPDPQSIRECAARMGGHTLSLCDWMIGDSWNDMRCAEASGVRGAFCDFGFGKLNDSPFDLRLSAFSEIPDALDAFGLRNS
ncbi:MAG: HAD-IA family hydrolase [Kiritimatiellae bacterium]|nr:HAD-IA family hydrolase [Kiritimatiellia bacterium]